MPFTIASYPRMCLASHGRQGDFRHTVSGTMTAVMGLTDLDLISFEAKEQPPAPRVRQMAILSAGFTLIRNANGRFWINTLMPNAF
jgi:hypothetical protein